MSVGQGLLQRAGVSLPETRRKDERGPPLSPGITKHRRIQEARLWPCCGTAASVESHRVVELQNTITANEEALLETANRMYYRNESGEN